MLAVGAVTTPGCWQVFVQRFSAAIVVPPATQTINLGQSVTFSVLATGNVGTISATLSSETTQLFKYPAPTPSVSANGNSNGIVWVLQDRNYQLNTGQAELLAYDATNLANLLYSSAQNPTRDNPGFAVKFGAPTIINGKVYVGTKNQLSVYGLLPSLSFVSRTGGGLLQSEARRPKILSDELHFDLAISSGAARNPSKP